MCAIAYKCKWTQYRRQPLQPAHRHFFSYRIIIEADALATGAGEGKPDDAPDESPAAAAADGVYSRHRSHRGLYSQHRFYLGSMHSISEHEANDEDLRRRSIHQRGTSSDQFHHSSGEAKVWDNIMEVEAAGTRACIPVQTQSAGSNPPVTPVKTAAAEDHTPTHTQAAGSILFLTPIHVANAEEHMPAHAQSASQQSGIQSVTASSFASGILPPISSAAVPSARRRRSSFGSQLAARTAASSGSRRSSNSSTHPTIERFLADAHDFNAPGSWDPDATVESHLPAAPSDAALLASSQAQDPELFETRISNFETPPAAHSRGTSSEPLTSGQQQPHTVRQLQRRSAAASRSPDADPCTPLTEASLRQLNELHAAEAAPLAHPRSTSAAGAGASPFSTPAAGVQGPPPSSSRWRRSSGGEAPVDKDLLLCTPDARHGNAAQSWPRMAVLRQAIPGRAATHGQRPVLTHPTLRMI